MNVGGGEAADQLVRMLLSGTEVSVRLGGSALKNLLALTMALTKNNKTLSGKVSLGKMLRETRDLRQFPMTPAQYKRFARLAKKQKILFSAMGPCLAMSTSCWMSLPLCPCRASPENWQPCAPETFQQAQLYKIWRKSRNYIRIRGRQSQATQTRFCTLAETKQQPISTFLRHLAKPRSIPKPMVSPRVDPGLGPPIFSRAVANC